MSSSEVSLRDRLGGRWAISLRAYLISAPIAIIVGVLATPESTESWSSLAKWTLISIMGFLMSGIPLYIAHRTILKDRTTNPVPIWLVYVVDIISVELRTVVFILCINAFDLPSSTPVLSRLVSAFILATVWYPPLTYALDSWDRYSKMRNQLIAELVADEIEVLNQQQVLEVLRLGLINDISTQVDESVRQAQDTLSSLRDAVAMEHSGEQVVATLNQINNDSIRKLSKELWNQQISTSSMKLFDLMRAMAHTRPFRPTYYIPPIALVSFVILNRSMSTKEAFDIVAVWLSYVLIVSVAGNFLCRKFNRFAFPIYLAVLGLFVSSGLITYFFATSEGLARVESVKWSIMASVTSAIFMPWFSMGSGISAHRQAVLTQLRSSIDQVEIRRLAINNERSTLNKQISTYLHGTVQANMSAAILRLQQSIEVGDREAATQALIDAREALNLKWDSSLGTHIDDLNASLAEIAQGWFGLVDITLSIEGAIPTRFNSMIHDIVIDAINNAVRHGEAELIDIVISGTSDGVNITITNNGHPLDVIGTGLGTETLNTYAPGNWSRHSTPTGDIELRVQLANR